MPGFPAARNNFYCVFLLLLPFLMCACSITRTVPPVSLPPAPMTRPPEQLLPRHDIMHTVAPGETLWRIGKMYDVPPTTIAHANHLSGTSVLGKGVKLQIPNAAPVQPVISLYPSKRWTHIIVHHSATDQGDALLFDKAHLNKGWDGIGYHFVIDNGSLDRKDGQVEVSPRWLKQLPGAHCKADGMNERGIGICLVGNFNNERPSSRQMNALAHLVCQLKTYYRISEGHVYGHGQVHGASTECPGRNFPWDDFHRRVKKLCPR